MVIRWARLARPGRPARETFVSTRPCGCFDLVFNITYTFNSKLWLSVLACTLFGAGWSLTIVPTYSAMTETAKLATYCIPHHEYYVSLLILSVSTAHLVIHHMKGSSYYKYTFWDSCWRYFCRVSNFYSL